MTLRAGIDTDGTQECAEKLLAKEEVLVERSRVTFTMDEDALERLDDRIEISYYRSRAHLIEDAVIELLDALDEQDTNEEE